MKCLLVVIVFLGAAGAGNALDCFNCIYNRSSDAPVHDPKCGDPFDETILHSTETCAAGQVCAKYPAYLGNNDGQIKWSIERKCGTNTGNGCITFSDASGYLKICGHFCQENYCNNADVASLHLAAILCVFLVTICAIIG